MHDDAAVSSEVATQVSGGAHLTSACQALVCGTAVPNGAAPASREWHSFAARQGCCGGGLQSGFIEMIARVMAARDQVVGRRRQAPVGAGRPWSGAGSAQGVGAQESKRGTAHGREQRAVFWLSGRLSCLEKFLLLTSYILTFK